MTEWFRPLTDGARVLPLTGPIESGWPDRSCEDRLSRLAFCPLGLSELHAVAGNIPLTALATPEGPLVGADLRSGAHLDRAGEWRFTYRPVALRLLPFVVLADGACARIMAPAQANTATPHPGSDYPRFNRFVDRYASDLGHASRLIGRAMDEGLARFAPGMPRPGQIPDLVLDNGTPHLRHDQLEMFRILALIEFSRGAAQTPPTDTACPAQPTPLHRKVPDIAQILSFDTLIAFDPPTDQD